ncbi:hypothetical protein HDE_02180 [Halotydeus destructor]|nr:hypothetical protein HDE_02180 [Halotydeus destructor]
MICRIILFAIFLSVASTNDESQENGIAFASNMAAKVTGFMAKTMAGLTKQAQVAPAAPHQRARRQAEATPIPGMPVTTTQKPKTLKDHLDKFGKDVEKLAKKIGSAFERMAKKVSDAFKANATMDATKMAAPVPGRR